MGNVKLGLTLIILALALVSANDKLRQKQALKNLIDQFNSQDGNNEIDINKYVETFLLGPLRIYVALNEPTDLIDTEFNWKHKFPHGWKKGKLHLNKGQLNGLSTIAIEGQSTLHREDENLVLTVPVTFEDLRYKYRYTTQFEDISVKGGVEGELIDTLYKVDITIIPKSLKMKLDRVTIIYPGEITTTVKGTHTTHMYRMLTSQLTKHFRNTELHGAPADKIYKFIKQALTKELE